MSTNFRPTRTLILQALNDQEMGRKVEPKMLEYLESIEKELEETSKSQTLAREIKIAVSLAKIIENTLQELSKVPKEALAAISKSHSSAVRMAKSISDQREYQERVKNSPLLGKSDDLGDFLGDFLSDFHQSRESTNRS